MIVDSHQKELDAAAKAQPEAVFDTGRGNFGDRLSREVRLTWHETTAATSAVTRRRRELERKIKSARERHAAGETVQHGTLAAHETEAEHLRRVEAFLTAAEDAMSRRASDRLKAALRTSNGGS